MTDQTLPAAGGSYIRNADGSLTLVEAPTADGYRLAARAAAMEAAPEGTPETAVQAPVEEGVAPAFKSRRAPAPAPEVKES
jgi:anti-sigma factor RsiW